MNSKRPTSTRDLLPSEARLVTAMQQLRFGRFELVRIAKGELMLDPWPTTVRGVKFASADPSASRTPPAEFELNQQMIELLEYVRAVDVGEIRCLEFRHGIPFSMEIEHQPDSIGGHRG